MSSSRQIHNCDEWGGAESRGNGARPVELMMMSDTCTTHRSRVPRRSSGRIKGGVTTVQDERGPGLDFTITFSVDLKFLIIALMVEMGIFTALALFLKPLH